MTLTNLNKLEKQYCKVLKFMLGIRTQTCNELPYLELGLPTLKAIILVKQFKFYKKILVHRDWPCEM